MRVPGRQRETREWRMRVLENFLELLPELFDRLRGLLSATFLVLGKTGRRQQAEKKYRCEKFHGFLFPGQTASRL
jgi:hypothetical protein